ncbi:flavodoxin [Streptomyces lucensis JCM 4490]|uniref:Flavodoxin n=1 Tax=Streptomyces lucensis JCM 4490 TaxID=1306176 RepID=A0A918J1H1_9ACTN|nr:flavodoxin domain-containing protein [Streptomyces lucensis]GGW42150.1 flavodoxin [Streptomyces lucensis JCM 4490]
MTRRVLVAYGTTNGSTAQLANAVAEVLREAGLAVETRPAREVTSLESCDAVVVGGALYAGRWHRDARRLVHRRRGDLAARPVWFFSSGPLDASASERDIPPVRGVRRAMIRVDARGHATFGGRLEQGAKGRMAKMIIDSGKGGDYRDFAAVRRWATGVADELTRG